VICRGHLGSCLNLQSEILSNCFSRQIKIPSTCWEDCRKNLWGYFFATPCNILCVRTCCFSK